MARKRATIKKATLKMAGKTKTLHAKKQATKTKVIAERKTKTKISSDHIQTHIIDDLIQKIVSAVDLDEKVRWSWGLMSECRVLENSSSINKHILKCKSCQDFLNARKSLAELVIRAARD
jgi:hypothetical protein